MKRKLMLMSPMLHQGGFERVCVTTARLLEPYFDITIIIFDSADIAYDVEGLKIIDIGMGVRKGKVKKLLNIVRRSHRVRQLKRQMRPDIVYSFGISANLVNAISRTGAEKIWIGLRSYGDMEERLKLRLFMRRGDLIVCCSRRIEQEINRKYEYYKTTTLYNPYDVKEIQKKAGGGDTLLPWGTRDKEGRRIRCIFSMGRDDELKGFWHMLKVFATVHAQLPQTRLVIMGDGLFENDRRLAEKLGVKDAVYFAGMQTEPYKYLRKGEIYLLTSLTEGFPNALVEGMSLGLAAVCTNCMTGPAEILLEDEDISWKDMSCFEQQEDEFAAIWGEYGILVPAMNRDKDYDAGHITKEEKNMAGIVIRLLQDEEMLKKYRQRAVERAQIFTYDNYIGQIVKMAE